MMSTQIVEDYLCWLEPQLRDEYGNPDKTYWELLNRMFEKPFEWSVPHDDNRMVDGLDLRMEYAYDQRIHISRNQMMSLAPCSFLEVLIGLSRRLAFAAGGNPPGWAWQLLDNLELTKMYDPLLSGRRSNLIKLEDVMNNVIYRTYRPDGGGGFFPLTGPDEDQTQVELWYQMAAYIEEIHPEY